LRRHWAASGKKGKVTYHKEWQLPIDKKKTAGLKYIDIRKH